MARLNPAHLGDPHPCKDFSVGSQPTASWRTVPDSVIVSVDTPPKIHHFRIRWLLFPWYLFESNLFFNLFHFWMECHWRVQEMQKGTYDTLADEASSSMFDESKWTPSRLKSLETFSRVPRIHVHWLVFFSACGDPPRLPWLKNLEARKVGAAWLVLNSKPPKDLNTRPCVARKVRSGTARVLKPPKVYIESLYLRTPMVWNFSLNWKNPTFPVLSINFRLQARFQIRARIPNNYKSSKK